MGELRYRYRFRARQVQPDFAGSLSGAGCVLDEDRRSRVVPMTIENRDSHRRSGDRLTARRSMRVLDTGAHTSFITMSAAARLLGIDENDPGVKLQGNLSDQRPDGAGLQLSLQDASASARVTSAIPISRSCRTRCGARTELLLGVGYPAAAASVYRLQGAEAVPDAAPRRTSCRSRSAWSAAGRSSRCPSARSGAAGSAASRYALPRSRGFRRTARG